MQTWLGSCVAVALAVRLAATAPIRPLAWEPPYVTGVAQEMAKRQTNKKTKSHKQTNQEKSRVIQDDTSL